LCKRLIIFINFVSMEHVIIAHTVKDFFRELVFNEEYHTYRANGVKYPSVSGLIGDFYTPFEAEKVAKWSGKKANKTAKQMLAEWKAIADKACNLGTRVHEFGERYTIIRFRALTDMTEVVSAAQHLEEGESLLPKEEAVIQFWNDMPEYYVPIILELKMFSKELEYAGTADIILLDTRDNSLVIGDYKTNKDLFKQYKDTKMLSPFQKLPECPHSKYQLQLSFYQILLEQTGYKVSRRFLVWLREREDGTGFYTMYDTPDHTKILRSHMKKKLTIKHGGW
jgi:hypothetical protein